MYKDPAHVRDNPIKPRFNDEEFAAIEALARLNHRQTAVFVRELVLRYLASDEQAAYGEGQVA